MSLLPIIIATVLIVRAVQSSKRRHDQHRRLFLERLQAFHFWRRKCLESLALMDQAQRHAELTGDYEPLKQAEQQMNTNLRRYEKDVLGLP